MNKTKLFCLPFAGGSAMMYIKWKKLLHPAVELCPLELAGRGKRFKDSFYESYDAAVDDAYHLIQHEIHKGPYALFGHSMGAGLAFDLCHKIKQAGGPPPEHLFLSGRKPPHLNPDDSSISNLPEKEFKEEILKLGGTSPEVAANKELLEIFLPVIRADYRILETRLFTGVDGKLDCPVTILNGTEDEPTPEELGEWQIYMNRLCKFHDFKGDHFFINDYPGEIVAIINQSLVKEYF